MGFADLREGDFAAFLRGLARFAATRLAAVACDLRRFLGCLLGHGVYSNVRSAILSITAVGVTDPGRFQPASRTARDRFAGNLQEMA